MFRQPQRILYPATLVLLVVIAYLLLHEPYRPLHVIPTPKVPFFPDDMDRASLIHAARKQAAYLNRQDKDKTVAFGEINIPYSWLLQSITEFIEKLQKEPDIVELNEFLKSNYQLYQAGGRKKAGRRKMLVTGYYEPLFPGSLHGTSLYKFPIYKVPPSLKRLFTKDNKSRVGRYNEQRQFVDFWARDKIEKQNLLFGYELAYLADRFDAYLLHVQGSGKIQLPDGRTVSISYAGSNGLEYNSIGKLLVDENKMDLKQASIPAIREYLDTHPDEVQRILHHNPRFIFFQWGDDQGPKGSCGEILTPGRSIAIDHNSLPGGTLAYLTTLKPVLAPDGSISSWEQFSRFVFPQDSGSAIVGTGRVDVFWGNGQYAEVAANNMKEEGKLYFLVKKGYPGMERPQHPFFQLLKIIQDKIPWPGNTS